jgi:hypothetical protein
MGNRLEKTDTATSTCFNANGNRLPDSPGGTYTWDPQNRMYSCTYQDQTTTFTHGSDGLRSSMTVGVTPYYGTMLVQVKFQPNFRTSLLNVTTTYMIGPTGSMCRL